MRVMSRGKAAVGTRSVRVPVLVLTAALLLLGCGGGSDSTDGEADADTTTSTSADAGPDSAVVACREFREAISGWTSHSINRSTLQDRLFQVRENAIASDQQDIADIGGGLLATLAESRSTFEAAVKNFASACAHVDH